MPQFTVGARLHDYGQGAVDEQFAKVAADGFSAVQLAYKKVVHTLNSYADVTDALAQQTLEAEQAHGVQVAVLGTYVELALSTDARLKNVADFKSQLRIAKKSVRGASAPKPPRWRCSLPVPPANRRRRFCAAAWRSCCPSPRNWAFISASRR